MGRSKSQLYHDYRRVFLKDSESRTIADVLQDLISTEIRTMTPEDISFIHKTKKNIHDNTPEQIYSQKPVAIYKDGTCFGLTRNQPPIWNAENEIYELFLHRNGETTGYHVDLIRSLKL